MQTRSAGTVSRGFTLVELLVSLVVATIVIAAAVVLLVNQQRTFVHGANDRALQETARIALDDLSANLRLAGFGMDPTMVFDFGATTNVAMDRAPTGSDVHFGGAFGCVNAVTCRDSAAGPDELVFSYRDPAFGHVATNVSTASVTLAGPLGAPLYQGQVLQLACYSGAMSWAYVTVGAFVPRSAAASVAVPLRAGAGMDFGGQNAALANTCFSGIVRAFKIVTSRYYVARFDAAGATQPWNTPGARPYLMLDQGLVDAGGNAIQLVVAPDVEDLQVSYQFPAAPTVALQLAGHVPGTALGNGAAGIDLAPAVGIPTYGTPRTHVRRTTHNPANIRAVRVAILVRSSGRDTTLMDAAVPAAGNRPATAGEIGYRRLLFETTTYLPNMDGRAPYFPTYTANAGVDQLNAGGG